MTTVNLKNPLYWHKHPNPWVRRPFLVAVWFPLFFVLAPLAIGWDLLRSAVSDLWYYGSEFLEDTWANIRELSGEWWTAVRYAPRIWWRPVDEQDAYAKKVRND